MRKRILTPLVFAVVALSAFGCNAPTDPIEIKIPDCVWDVWNGCSQG